MFRFPTIIFIFTSAQCVSINTTSMSFAKEHLHKYGYMANEIGEDIPHVNDTIREAIILFQNFAGIEATGNLDRNTIRMMSLPRCGMVDIYKGKRNFTVWKRTSLYYKILEYPKNINSAEIDKEIQAAFNIWSKYTNLTFSPRKRKEHFTITFSYRHHGDPSPFDGPGNVVGHATYPQISYIHFDSEENWTINSEEGINLYQTAVHEIGHALGLEHSKINTSIMTPIYTEYIPRFRTELHKEDIARIQKLYGNKTDSQTVKQQDVCSGNVASYNTIFRTKENITYVLYNDKYIQFDDDKLNTNVGYLCDKWIGLPSTIDGAFESKDGIMYFFKGWQYWKYNGSNVMTDNIYPRGIFQGFGYPLKQDINLVFQWNGILHLFKDYMYYEYTFDTGVMESKNRRDRWKDLPKTIMAAITNNSHIYFFAFEKYYIYENSTYRGSGNLSDYFNCDDKMNLYYYT